MRSSRWTAPSRNSHRRFRSVRVITGTRWLIISRMLINNGYVPQAFSLVVAVSLLAASPATAARAGTAAIHPAAAPPSPATGPCASSASQRSKPPASLDGVPDGASHRHRQERRRGRGYHKGQRPYGTWLIQAVVVAKG